MKNDGRDEMMRARALLMKIPPMFGECKNLSVIGSGVIVDFRSMLSHPDASA